jgi:hypothetical protein
MCDVLYSSFDRRKAKALSRARIILITISALAVAEMN